jgi:hypothetical protein
MHLLFLLVNKHFCNYHLLIISKNLHNNHFCHLQRTRKLCNSHFLLSPNPNDKEALQLPSTHTETEAPKDKEASPVSVMPPPPSRTTNPPLSSPHNTIHKDLALCKIMTHLDPTDQFFMAIKNLKSPSRTSSVMSRLAQHAEMYMRACEI